MIYLIIIGVIIYFLFFRSGSTDKTSYTVSKPTVAPPLDPIAEKYRDYATFSVIQSGGFSCHLSNFYSMSQPRYFAKDGKIIRVIGRSTIENEEVIGYYYSKETNPPKNLKSLTFTMDRKTGKIECKNYSTNNMRFRFLVTDEKNLVYGFVPEDPAIVYWENFEGLNSASVGSSYLTSVWISNDKLEKAELNARIVGDKLEACAAFVAFMNDCSESGNMNSWHCE